MTQERRRGGEESVDFKGLEEFDAALKPTDHWNSIPTVIIIKISFHKTLL
jgi:hypothetical protein